MKKLLLPLLLLSVIAFAGCTDTQQGKTVGQRQTDMVAGLNNPINTTTTSTNTMTSDQIFQKKKECADLSDKMKKQFDSLYPCFDLIEMFYSPLRNSCLYIEQYRNIGDCLAPNGHINHEKIVWDYFTNEELLEDVDNERIGRNDIYGAKSDVFCSAKYDSINDPTLYNECMKNQFNIILQELKGE